MPGPQVSEDLAVLVSEDLAVLARGPPVFFFLLPRAGFHFRGYRQVQRVEEELVGAVRLRAEHQVVTEQEHTTLADVGLDDLDALVEELRAPRPAAQFQTRAAARICRLRAPGDTSRRRL